MSSYILGTSHAYLSYIFGKSKTYSINISDMSKKHLKPISNISQAYLWQIMGIPYSCIWHFLYMSQIYLWHISGKFLFLIFQLILISLISIASQERNFVLVYPQIAILTSGWFQKYAILMPGQCQKNATVRVLKVSLLWKWK